MKLSKLGRAIWNGPFFVGKLSQPVSLGDVLLKLLETIWRVIILMAVGLAVLFVYISYLDERLFPPLRTQIETDVIFDPAVSPEFRDDLSFEENISLTAPWCREEMPLRLVLFNRSDQTISNTTYSIEAYESGSSRNLAVNAEYITNDQILNPGEHRISCHSIALSSDVDPATLQYRAVVKWVNTN